MRHHVFLSYSHKDTEAMRHVRDDLRAEGLAVWNDENLTPGTPSWKNAIEQAIENTGCLVVILSPDAKGSEWIEREMDYARACGVPILPVLAGGDERSAIPFELINVQLVDIRSDYETGFRHLVAAVRGKVDASSSLQNSVQESPRRHALPPMDRWGLDPWNVFDQFRLLVWLLLTPERLMNYRAHRDDESIRQVGVWLVSTLAWLPLVIPTLGYSLGTIPVATSSPLNLFFVWALFVVGWFATGWLNMRDSRLGSFIAFLIAGVVTMMIFLLIGGLDNIELMPGAVAYVAATMALGLAFGVGFGVASRATGIVAGIIVALVMFMALFNRTLGPESALVGIALIGMTLGVTTIIQRSMETGMLSRLHWGVLTAVLVTYGALVWIYFLGGWSVLSY